MYRDFFPGKGTIFFLLRDVLTGSGTPPPDSYSVSTGSSFLKIKLLCLKLPTHLPLMAKLIILGATHFLTPYTLMACIRSTLFCDKYQNMILCKPNTTIIYYYYYYCVECQIIDSMFRPFIILTRPLLGQT